MRWIRVQRHVAANKLVSGVRLNQGKNSGKAVAFLTDISKSGMIG